MRDDDDDLDDDDDDDSELDSEDVGAIGQGAFAFWCAQKRIVPIVSTRDKYGWDYLLQWASPSHDPLAPPEITCKVQVKATRTRRAFSSIKLSNWARMVKETTPWFIAGIRLEGSSPSEVHLVPVDEQLVARAHKRLATTPEGELHRKKMRVTWSARHRLREPFYDALYRILLEHIGSSQPQYEAQKRLWNQKAYDATQEAATTTPPGHRPEASMTAMAIPEFGGTVHISAKSEAEVFDRITQLAVGLISDITIDRVVPNPDVELPVDFDPRDLKLTIPPRERDFETTLTFYDRDRAEQVELVRDVFASQRVALARTLPQRFQRMRFTGPLVTFEYRFGDDEHPASFSAHWELPGVTPVPLDALAKVARLARMFGNASRSGLGVRVEFPDGTAGAIDLSAAPEGAEPDFLEQMRAAEDAGTLARYFDLDGRTLTVNTEELRRFQFPLRIFAAAVDRAVADLGVAVVIEPDEPVAGKRSAVILTAVVPLADRVLAGIFCFVGRATWTPMTGASGTMGVEDAEFRIHKTTVMRRDEWDTATFRERVTELAQQLESEGIEVVARAP